MDWKEWKLYERAYVVFNNKCKIRISNGVKVNHETSKFEMVTGPETSLLKAYKETVTFDIVCFITQNVVIILHSCCFLRIDLSMDGMISKGTFLSEQEVWD